MVGSPVKAGRMAQFQIARRQLKCRRQGDDPACTMAGRGAAQILGALLCLPLLDARRAFASAGFDERVEVVRAIIYGDLFSNTDGLFG
jgi:hypothetical protein